MSRQKLLSGSIQSTKLVWFVCTREKDTMNTNHELSTSDKEIIRDLGIVIGFAYSLNYKITSNIEDPITRNKLDSLFRTISGSCRTIGKIKGYNEYSVNDVICYERYGDIFTELPSEFNLDVVEYKAGDFCCFDCNDRNVCSFAYDPYCHGPNGECLVLK